MNISRIYHGGPAGVSGGGGGGGGWPYAHGLVGLFWSDPIPINLDLGDLFTVALDPTTNNIQNPTGGTNGKFFTIGLMQHNAPGAPVTWGSDYVFNLDSLGNVLYPKIFYRAYDWVYIHFIKWYDKFHMVGQWPDFTHQISDSAGLRQIECLGDVIYLRGTLAEIETDFDLTIDITRDLEINVTRYLDINSTEDVVFDFGTSFDMIVADYGDIDIGDDLNVDVALDFYLLVGNDFISNITHDFVLIADNDINLSTTTGTIWAYGAFGLSLACATGDADLTALAGKLYLGGYGAGAAGGIHVPTGAVKEGANQGAAGAIAGEMWLDTTDNTFKRGV